MKLIVNTVTGLVALKAVKDTGTHLIGDIFGLRPLQAASAIESGLVVPTDHDPEAKTEEVEVEGDVIANVPAPESEPPKPDGGKADGGDGGDAAKAGATLSQPTGGKK